MWYWETWNFPGEGSSSSEGCLRIMEIYCLVSVLTLLPFLCCLTPHHRHSQGHRDCSLSRPLSTPVIYRQVSSCTHQVHKSSLCWKHNLCPVWQVQQSHCRFPKLSQIKGFVLAVPWPQFFRTGLQHHVHVLLITQYPVIIHGPSSGESLIQRK